MPATFCYTIIWTMIAPRTKKLVSFKNTATFKNTVQTECSFELKNVTVEDSGTYYCLVVYGKMVYAGNGSEVIVTKGENSIAYNLDITRNFSWVLDLKLWFIGVCLFSILAFAFQINKQFSLNCLNRPKWCRRPPEGNRIFDGP